jgi:hypothetical protein
MFQSTTSNDGVSLWQDSAKCKGADSTVFFSNGTKDTRYRKFCDNCEVRSSCRDYALVYNLSGIWGGTTDKERSKYSPQYLRDLRDDLEESGMYHKELKA